MVAQAAVPLYTIAASMGMSVPAVVEYFRGQNIDLSGYGENDLVDLETLFPQTESQRIKEYKTYDESFYDAPPVVGDTSLNNIVLQTKKDDDEVIDVKEEDLEVMPRTDLSTEPPEDPKDPDPDLILEGAETVARKLAQEGTEKLIDKTIDKLANKFLAKDKNTKQYIEALNPDKIKGNIDIRTIDYSDKTAPTINYAFDDKTLKEIGTESITQIDDQVNVDMNAIVDRTGFTMPNKELINRALSLGAEERYWYQKGAHWLNDFLSDFNDEEKAAFFDILSITSGGVEPKENLKLAIGVFSDYLNNRPIRIGFRQAASLNKFLTNPDQMIQSPKFGNYVDTFKYFTGIGDREPNTVNDLQMASIFGIDQSVLASNPELYALITRATNNMVDEINGTVREGDELQPLELQALLWSAKRGASSNYAQMGEELLAELQDQGFIFDGNKLNRNEIADRSFVEKLQTTVAPYGESMKATIEVGTTLTDNGKKIAQLIDNFPNDKPLMNQISLIHKSNLTKLISRKKGRPSIMEDLVSLVLGQKAELSRMQTGLGTYDGRVSFNAIVPFTAKVKNEFVKLSEPQRLQVLSLLGTYLDQEAMAASNFSILEEEKDKKTNAMKTAQLYVPSKYTKEDVQKLQKLTGLDFNVTPVPGGFVASILSFDGMPSEKDLSLAFDKVFGEDKEMVYIPSEWVNDYVKSKNYKGNINDLTKSISERMEEDGATSFNIEYLDSIISILQAISGQREKSYGELLNSKKVINLLTKKNLTLKRKGGFIEIPKFHFGGFIDTLRV